MSDDLDPLVYGGGHAPTLNDAGVGKILIAPDIVLSNDFEMDVIKPGEISDNQDRPAAVITFKGVDGTGKTVKAVTVVLDPEGLRALVRAGRAKYAQIPLEYR